MVHAQQQRMATNTRFDSLKDDVSSTKGRTGSRRHGRRHDSNHKSKGTKQSQLYLKKNSSPAGFSMNSSAFPKLSKGTDTKTTVSTMDFASAAKPEEHVTIVDEVDPGWVKIRRDSNTNKIVHQYNRNHPSLQGAASTVTSSPEDNPSSKGLDENQEEALYFLTERWQDYRDEQNTQYPETSPFIDAKSLLEDLSDDCYETESDLESESDLSVYDSDEYNDDEF